MVIDIRLNIKNVLERKGMSQKDLAEKTGLRTATISEMVNNRRSAINKEHLIAIMNALQVYDINEFIEVVEK